MFARAAAAHQSGNLAEAEMLYRQILNANPNHAEAHSRLGFLYQHRGETARAIEQLTQAAALRPKSADIVNNLGLVHLGLGDLEPATECFEKAIAIDPKFAAAHRNLGLVFRSRRNFDRAIASFKKAILLAPDDASAYVMLGNTLSDCGRRDEAAAQYKRYTDRFPSSREARYELALALDATGRIGEAAVQLREVLSLIPGLLDAYNKLGVTSTTLGKFGDAEAYFKSALAIQPDFPDAIYGLASCSKVLSESQTAARIESYLATDKPAEKQTLLHFALGKIYDDLGNYPRAFEHYKKGNDIVDATAGFDAEVWATFLDRIKNTFTRRFFSDRASLGSDSRQPIFIFGVPRSGTTLVEQIVSSHPQVAAAGELDAIPEMTWNLQGRFGLERPYPDCMNELDAKAIRTLADAYLAEVNARVPPAGRVTDKMPGNFVHLGFLALVFPKATFIHCRRDPLDTCLSCYFTRLSPRNGFAHNLRNLGLYYRGYQKLMAHWSEVLPISMIEVSYEDLIADQEGTSRRLIAHCGLEWDDRCLTFHETVRPVHTGSVWQVRQPLYKTAVKRWRHYEAFLGPLRAALEEQLAR